MKRISIDILTTRWLDSSGKQYHLNGPAVKRTDGDKFWYKNDFIKKVEAFNK